jgi:hypothetical protein
MGSLEEYSAEDVCEVSADWLRELFNKLGLTTRGDVYATVISDGHPAPSRSGEPFCTRSQRLLYRTVEGDRAVAQAHRYLRPDGTIGASGLVDPKLVLHDGTVYGAP